MENIKSMTEWNNIVASNFWRGNDELVRQLYNRFLQLRDGSAGVLGTPEFWEAHSALNANAKRPSIITSANSKRNKPNLPYSRRRCKVGRMNIEYTGLPEKDPDNIYDVPEMRELLTESKDVSKILQDHWHEIRTEYMQSNGLIYEYNLRLPNHLPIEDFLERVHAAQKSAYRINIRLGYILRSVEGEFRFYYQSCNTALFDDSRLVTVPDDFNKFLEDFRRIDIQQTALTHSRPDSKWTLHMITNAAVIIWRLQSHPIAGGIELPHWIRDRRSIISLDKDTRNGRPYRDNLCFFRCLVTHRGSTNFGGDVRANAGIWAEHTGQDLLALKGVMLADLDKIEKMFDVAIAVYSLIPIVNDGDCDEDSDEGDISENLVLRTEKELTAIKEGKIAAELIRRPKYKSANAVMYLNLYENEHAWHFSYIKDFNTYSKTWQCKTCKRLCTHHGWFNRHTKTCKGANIKHIFPGGAFALTKTVWEMLESEGIRVPLECRFYPFYATFDFEAYSEQESGARIQFDQFVKECPSLPTEEQDVLPRCNDEFLTKHWKKLYTKYTKSRQCYRIRCYDTSDIPHFMLGITSIQETAFTAKITLIMRQGEGLTRRCLNIGIEITNEARYYEFIRAAEGQLSTIANKECLQAVEINISQRKTTVLQTLIPASVSISCNFRNTEGTKFLLSTGNPSELIEQFLIYIDELSAEAEEILRNKYSGILEHIAAKQQNITEKLANLIETWPSLKSKQVWKNVSAEIYRSYRHLSSKARTFDIICRKLDDWLCCLPVLSFCGQRFDLPLIRQHLFPLLLKSKCKPSIVRKNSGYMSIKTPRYNFLDIANYISPGTSYDKWLKANRIKQQKGFWCHDVFTSLDFLSTAHLPPKSAFYSELKGTEITDDDYTELSAIWQRENMTTMADMLRYYNNLDVIPFLEGVEQMRKWWQDKNIDMLKQGMSLPGLALTDIMQTREHHSIFVLENEQNKDLFYSIKENVVGGPSIVFCRYHEKMETKIRDRKNGKDCDGVLGYDAAALYLYCTMQAMPCGIPVRWTLNEDNFFKRRSFYPRCQKQLEWLEWTKHSMCINIDHLFSTGRQPMVAGYAVDGVCEAAKVVFQFDGCYFHKHCCHLTKNNNWSMPEVIRKTTQDYHVKRNIEAQGYTVIRIRECEWEHAKKRMLTLQQFRRNHFQLPNHYAMTQEKLLGKIRQEKFFGIVELDIETPDHLKEKFAEYQPIFKNINISREDLKGHMHEYALYENLLQQPVRTLVGSYFGEKIMLATPLLKWYLDHGLVVTRIYEAFEFKPKACFKKFGETVTDARRAADIDPELASEGEKHKLEGNSCYGKTITNVEKHTNCTVCNRSRAETMLTDPFFSQMDHVGPDTYEVRTKKKSINFKLPHLVGYFVYQYAKLRMLEFYYDFLDRFFDRGDWELIETDTDSLYMAVSNMENFEGLVKPGMLDEYVQARNTFLPRKGEFEIYDQRTPGLFKVEWKGDGMIAMNSKTYVGWGPISKKLSTKGLPKAINTIGTTDFRNILRNKRSVAGIVKSLKRMRDGTMRRIDLIRYGLTYLYCKRIVMDDGVSTMPYDDL